jgi:hypothetical protein
MEKVEIRVDDIRVLAEIVSDLQSVSEKLKAANGIHGEPSEIKFGPATDREVTGEVAAAVEFLHKLKDGVPADFATILAGTQKQMRESGKLPRVACLMMQKDEDHLLEPWIQYHAYLFGIENLFIWDNGSSSEQTKRILKEYQGKGLNVDFSYTTEVDFRRKGVILGDKIKELDSLERYDFYFPVDCDEFLVLRQPDDKVLSDRSSILRALMDLDQEIDALGMNWAYYNIIGHQGHFWGLPHKKTFFRSGTFKIMDHGYHEGKSKLSEGRKDTDFAYMHYHHKPHAIIVEHSKNKLRPYMNIDNEEELRAVYDKNRLVRFILDSEEQYLKKFTKDKAIYIPHFEASLRRAGLLVPFER